MAIVGAGFGGLAVAIELTRAGIDSFEVYERADRVGGVWRENTYPGAGCDIPSPFYSFSYRPNARWPQRFSLQAPILEYAEACVAEFGLGDRIRFGAHVSAARFVAERRVWELTVNGSVREADVLVCACGQLSRPALPRVEGRERFGGHSFHSAQWDHDYDLSGRRVAVIGSGASAIQFVPQIAPVVERLHLFQRSAPYVIPKPDRVYAERHHRAFARWPWLLRAERLGWYLFCEYGTKGVTSHPSWIRPWVAAWRAYLRLSVRDRRKRELLTPDYEPGCKRVLFSRDYYQAMDRDNVEIIPGGVTRITEHSVVSASGAEREVDAIIYATGFEAHAFVAPMEVRGRDGQRLVEDAWSGGASAYLGMTVPGFPNLFLVYGPNTNLGSGSIIYMHESAARYIVDAVRHMAGRGAAWELRDDALRAWDREVQARLSRTVWATGCHSWYIDESGRNASNWPGSMREYRRRTARFDPSLYRELAAA